jgi:hypothetical protein
VVLDRQPDRLAFLFLLVVTVDSPEVHRHQTVAEEEVLLVLLGSGKTEVAIQAI